ncbi:MAG: mCpol domain-containing protein [Nostoc sp.]|uniref:mCpol domain-containing protein n=1 Tax=Nostoc sp. TaxID=1180 RepID=UPI002FF7B02F
MAALIILGNVDQSTFANSILASSCKAQEIFNEPLNTIFVIHSEESQARLNNETGWVDHLQEYGIGRDLFAERIIEISSEEESIKKFVSYIEMIIKGSSENSHFMIDLTNGTTLQKNILSVAAYILDLQYVYVIDIIELSKRTKDRGFLNPDVLVPSYIPAPDSTKLDSIAYLDLAEMFRYKRIVEKHTQKYAAIDPTLSDSKFFQDNLLHSIDLKFSGDRKRDNAIYRIAASSISASVEDLISLLLMKFVFSGQYEKLDRRTLGQKLDMVYSRVENSAPPDFDLEFFNKFNDFIKYLRNSTTHKGRLLTDLERFKAELSVKLSFPFIEFYTDIVFPLLSLKSETQKQKQIKLISSNDIKLDDIFYYGLDGDDTGFILEELFVANSDQEKFKQLSQSVKNAISEIIKFLRERYKKSTIIFDAGDDLLFRGKVSEEDLKRMQEIYYETTSGLTCSIGYGRSFQEVYLALKLAKTQPGKNAVVGIQLV